MPLMMPVTLLWVIMILVLNEMVLKLITKLVNGTMQILQTFDIGRIIRWIFML